LHVTLYESTEAGIADGTRVQSRGSVFGRAQRGNMSAQHSTPARRAARHLVGDERGAIMVIGLFMAVALVGSLWFIMGIGDAIVLRDRAIEAADHAVFSAATVHARGMNYLSALNLIMFAIACMYVALALIANIVIAVGVLGGSLRYHIPLFGTKCRWIPSVCPECAPMGKAACEAGHKLAKLAEDFNEKTVKPTFKAITALETVVQTGFPLIAEVTAVKVAKDYQFQGIVLAPSLIPSLAKSDGPGGLGLPVKAIQNTFLCRRAFNEVEQTIGSFIPPPFSTVIDFVIGLMEDWVMNRPPKDTAWGIGCHGAPWTDNGIHVVNDGVENGNDYLQMWGLIVDAKDTDVGGAESKISVAGTKGFGGKGQTDPGKNVYYAQAEYYFNCRGFWFDLDCYDSSERNASFSMNWKARLRRVHAPSFGNKMIGLASQGLLAGNLTNFIAGQMSQSPAALSMAASLQALMNGLGGNVLTRTDLGTEINGATDFLTGAGKPIH